MLQAAEDHYRQQASLAAAASRQAARAWDRLPVDALDDWQPLALARTVGALQLAAASFADPYVTAALEVQGIDPAATAGVVPAALAGVAGDGRSLVTLLDEPRIQAKAAIGQGVQPRQAWQQARSTLRMMALTAVQDAGRVGVGVGVTARPHAGGYVRMLNTPSCSRCAVLAGKFYRWNAGFQRHPRCDCRHVPTQENVAGDLTTDPRAYFDSLSTAEQDGIFTKAGAQAIRDGADIGQVVNARRGAFGMAPAGARITRAEAQALRGGRDRGSLQRQRIFGHDLFTTTEGVTRRGIAGQRLGAWEDGVRPPGSRYASARVPRLMPESIYEIAGDDRNEALRLLKRFGYLN